MFIPVGTLIFLMVWLLIFNSERSPPYRYPTYPKPKSKLRERIETVLSVGVIVALVIFIVHHVITDHP